MRVGNILEADNVVGAAGANQEPSSVMRASRAGGAGQKVYEDTDIKSPRAQTANS